MIVNQWVPAAHRGDAIGDSARRVRDLLRGMGHESELYALTIDDDLEGDVRPFSDPAARRGDLTIFHYALPSPMTAAFAALRSRPRAAVPQRHAGAYLRALRPGAVPAGVARPRRSWRRWSAASTWRSAISEYNRQELEALGFAPTGVLPIAVDTVAHHAAGRAGRRSNRSWTTSW